MHTAQLCSEVIQEFDSNYVFRKYLGKGAFSVVIEAQSLENFELVALKIIDKCHMKPQIFNSLKSEIEILQGLNHPHIIQLLHVKETNNALYIATEIMKGGSLGQLIAESKLSTFKLTDEECSTLVKGILDGVDCIHNYAITHRDLKPDNIMLFEMGKYHTIKIADFGLSERASLNSNEQCGTPIYMAPELLNGRIYSQSVDLWAVGIIMYQLLTGNHPFYHCGDTIEIIKEKANHLKLGIVSDISSLAQSLISKLIAFNPSDRYTARKALSHPWITRKIDDPIPLTCSDIEMKNECKIKLMSLLKVFKFLGSKSLLNGTPMKCLEVRKQEKNKKCATDDHLDLILSNSNSTEISEKAITTDYSMVRYLNLHGSYINHVKYKYTQTKPNKNSTSQFTYYASHKKWSYTNSAQKSKYPLNLSMCKKDVDKSLSNKHMNTSFNMPSLPLVPSNNVYILKNFRCRQKDTGTCTKLKRNKLGVSRRGISNNILQTKLSNQKSKNESPKQPLIAYNYRGCTQHITLKKIKPN